MFEQNEQALQMRISSAREQFQEAKECLDASKTAAGQVTEISDEEELPGDSETSAMQITESIQDTFQFLAEALQRCRIHPSGGTGRQEAKNGRKLCGRRFQAAFQLGGLSMTLWYSSRKPDVFDVPAIAALKWSHSFICEPDFCCEFGARESSSETRP